MSKKILRLRRKTFAMAGIFLSFVFARILSDVTTSQNSTLGVSTAYADVPSDAGDAGGGPGDANDGDCDGGGGGDGGCS